MVGEPFTTGMDRRGFLRVTAAGLAGAVLSRAAMAGGAAGEASEIVVETARLHNFRVLQVTDTSFGVASSEGVLRDRWARHTLRRLVDEQKPDLIVHTGDLLDQSRGAAGIDGVTFMDDLGVAWALAPGNRDRSEEHRDGVDRVLQASRRCLTRPLVGDDGEVSYVFRVDLRARAGGEERAVLLGFDTGYRHGAKRVGASQLVWLKEQKMAADAAVLAFQHIPLRQFREVAESEQKLGTAGEPVNFGDDDGRTLDAYKAARVRAVFCGHDHANDFSGEHDGVTLACGRVTGWTGHGELQRGGRLMELNLSERSFSHRVVLPRGLEDCGPKQAERESAATR